MFKYLNRGISTSLAIIIIVALALILISGILVFQYKFPETGLIIFFPKLGITFSGDCNKLIKQINNLVEKANYCDEDSDCVVSTEINVCPWSCYNLFNKDANLAKIREGIEKYKNKECVDCVSECMLLPKPEDIKCQNNKCVDIRITKRPINEIFEECVEASSFAEYYKTADIELFGYQVDTQEWRERVKEIEKTIKPSSVPVRSNFLEVGVYNLTTGAAGGDILTTPILKSGNYYCKLTEPNFSKLFFPIRKEEAIKYLDFRFVTLDGYESTIFTKQDYQGKFCPEVDIKSLKESDKKITTLQEINDGFLISWITYTQIDRMGFYEFKVRIKKDASIQILEWPKKPFIDCGPGVVP